MPYFGTRRETIEQLIEKKDNILFLDYDGVVNTESQFDPKCIHYLNKFCRKYHFHIVVCSSWRNYYHYKEILYAAGLDKNIIIDGKTDEDKNRVTEIKKYVQSRPYLGCYIIIDDEELVGLEKYQIRTEKTKGFNRAKYHEAVRLYKKMTSIK